MILETEGEARAFIAARSDAATIDRLERLETELRVESQKQNLVSAASLDDIWVRHFADSAQLLDHVPRETGLWLDLGTGAGFPGLVIAAMRPEREVLLVETRRLRIDWLRRMIGHLGLGKCHVAAADVKNVETCSAAVISARAFAPLQRLVDVSARFSTSATTWVLPKGRSAEQEVAELPLTLRSRFHVKQSLTAEHGKIVIAKGRLDMKSA